MKNISGFLILFCLLHFSISSGAQMDSVKVIITEESMDSLGPWQYKNQVIDSLDSSGRIEFKLHRTWDGNIWVNSKSETFLYTSTGQLTEHKKFNWDGHAFSPQQKTETTYDSNDKILTETTYRYEVSNWIPLTRREYIYSSLTHDYSILLYNFFAGNWIVQDEYLLLFNSGGQEISEMWRNYNGSSWDTIRLTLHEYSQHSGKILSDSVYYFSEKMFLPYNTNHYEYDMNGKMEAIISKDFYSFVNIEPDTAYVISEVEHEYTLNLKYNANGELTEKHGYQTRGSSQNMTYEYNYYGYNQLSLPSYQFSHTGSNLSNIYNRTTTFYYSLMQSAFNVNIPSCVSCSDGSIDISIKGGVPDYIIETNSSAASINGRKVEFLSSGLHTICITDAIGNKTCADVSIPDHATGIHNPTRDNTWISVFHNENESSLQVESNLKGDVYFSVIDASGKTVYNNVLIKAMTYLPITNLSSGIYFFNASAEGVRKSGRIILTAR